jgi:hypothetical protein
MGIVTEAGLQMIEREKCIAETMKHKENVERFLDLFINALTAREILHDNSKMEEPELSIFVEYTNKLKGTTYGSEEYKRYLQEMKPALDHHYANNRHHPEFHENGIDGMNLIDLVEMFCDWMAATMRHDDGDILKSIEINKQRFNMSDQLASILRNTVELMRR